MNDFYPCLTGKLETQNSQLFGTIIPHPTLSLTLKQCNVAQGKKEI
jgi:hypothetical protein